MSRRHEQLLFRYSSALDRGDFEVVADVLREAEHDPALEQMILDMNDAYTAERFNHTNPKEIPMIAPLYQKQNRIPQIRWQGLSFVAALAVIAVLTTLLVAQTRGYIPGNLGQQNPPPAVAQINPTCEGILRDTTDAYSRPSVSGIIVGTIKAGSASKVLDQVQTGETPQSWYFVVAEGPNGVQGWILASALEAPGCAPITPAEQPTSTPLPPTIVPPLTPTIDPAAIVVLPAAVAPVNALLEAIAVANVRTAPDSAASAIGEIQSGEFYLVTGRWTDWVQFAYPPSPTGTGWVAADLVRPGRRYAAHP